MRQTAHNRLGRLAYNAKRGTFAEPRLASASQWLVTDTKFERMVDALSPRRERVAKPVTLRKFSWEE